MANEMIDASGGGTNAQAWLRGLASVVALAAALLLIALVVMVANSNHARDAALARERQSYDILVITRALDSSMAHAEASLGRFVISGDKATGRLYVDEWRRAGAHIRRLEQLTRSNAEQASAVRELKALYERRGQELDAPAANANFRRGWSALGLFNEAGKARSVGRIAELLERIVRNERAILGRRSAEAEITAARSNQLADILSALGIVIGVGSIILGWFTFRAIADGRTARRMALVEAERAETLEHRVAERTIELSAANERLREEMATRAAAEAQLRQVQKMEAVGQLTGGIAHDFNNMLAVVVGGLDLARRRLTQETDEVGRHIDNAMEGANRAAALTRRLLSFARAEPLLPEGVDPGKLIAGMSDLLDRTLGERVTVTTRIESAGWQVWVDAHQLENAILNLAVNARDAMENEGKLSIATANVVLANGQVGEVKAGDYVRITVADDGCGMSQAVLDRVFEPFFTTKPVGKGTGLGLSQLFGFARQSGGEVGIQSKVGLGTTVSVYLPRHIARPERIAPPAPAIAQDPVAPENDDSAVLVVEDDVRVRVATVAALEELGYRPLPCASADEAIGILEACDDIRLIITDVVMPGMSGPELIERVAPLYPDISVLFVTGYVGDAGEAAQLQGYELLRKPFTVSGLAHAVAAALERGQRAAA